MRNYLIRNEKNIEANLGKEILGLAKLNNSKFCCIKFKMIVSLFKVKTISNILASSYGRLR